VPIRCHIASHKVPRCRPHGSPVAGHRPSSRYVYSSWTPCLRTPLATGSCGIAKQGATAATCGTPGLRERMRSRAPAGSGRAASPLAESTQVCGRCQARRSQQQQPQSRNEGGGSRARVASGYAFTAAASSESLRERGGRERVARTRSYSYVLTNNKFKTFYAIRNRTRFFSVWLLFSALPSSASCRWASFCSAAHKK